MTSKEALKILFMTCDDDLLLDNYNILFSHKISDIIEKDLDRLEKLEEFVQFLKRETNIHIFNVKHNDEDEEILMINGRGIVLDSKESELTKNVLYGG